MFRCLVSSAVFSNSFQKEILGIQAVHEEIFGTNLTELLARASLEFYPPASGKGTWVTSLHPAGALGVTL